jgi:hypothetical protein
MTTVKHYPSPFFTFSVFCHMTGFKAAAIENETEALIKLLLAKDAKMNYRYGLGDVLVLEDEDLLRRLRRDMVVVDEVEEIRRRLEDCLDEDGLNDSFQEEVVFAFIGELKKRSVRQFLTPLSGAAERGNVAVVRLLLEKGAEVNALQGARLGGDQAVVRLLEAAKQSLLEGDLG